MNRLTVVIMFVIEIPFALCILVPNHYHFRYLLRYTRLVCAHAMNALMVMIMVTGNYNFFNLLTMVLTVSCMDDEHVQWCMSIGNRLMRVWMWPFSKLTKKLRMRRLSMKEQLHVNMQDAFTGGESSIGKKEEEEKEENARRDLCDRVPQCMCCNRTYFVFDKLIKQH